MVNNTTPIADEILQALNQAHQQAHDILLMLDKYSNQKHQTQEEQIAVIRDIEHFHPSNTNSILGKLLDQSCNFPKDRIYTFCIDFENLCTYFPIQKLIDQSTFDIPWIRQFILTALTTIEGVIEKIHLLISTIEIKSLLEKRPEELKKAQALIVSHLTHFSFADNQRIYVTPNEKTIIDCIIIFFRNAMLKKAFKKHNELVTQTIQFVQKYTSYFPSYGNITQQYTWSMTVLILTSPPSLQSSGMT